MEIKTVKISLPQAGNMKCDAEGLFHKKALPCISVVQSLHGNYEVALDGGKFEKTEEGGVFAAPADKLQSIIHRNGKNGYIKAQWAFLHIRVNDYRFEDVFDFPLILPSRYDKRVAADIRNILSGEICMKYSAGYDLAQILIENSTEISPPDPVSTEIRSFVLTHFTEDIKAKDIASNLHVSTAQVYRFTKKYFSLSPSNYVNRIRLQHALELLHDPNVQIKRAAFESGFIDLAYFSRLFKTTFGVSPRDYRRGLE